MTKDTKYGILMLIGLLIIVPVVFLLINLSVHTLGLIFNYPGYCLTALLGAFAGSALTKLSK